MKPEQEPTPGGQGGEEMPYRPGEAFHNEPRVPSEKRPYRDIAGQTFPYQPSAPSGVRQNPETLEELIRGDGFVDRVIGGELAAHEDFSLSAGLPENQSAADWDSYERQMAGYHYSPSRNPKFFQEARKQGLVKYDYDSIQDRNPNIAWKLHLNVMPKDIQAVADFLRTNAYHHKYLSGGDPGNTFTIYIGSYKLASKSAAEISAALEGRLCKPVSNGGEIEMARGISGRFRGSTKQGFHQYGFSGFTLFKDFIINTPYQDRTSEVYKSRLVLAKRRAFRSLVKLYGDYFLPQEQIMKYAQ
jgi:hypothetical protein